MVPKDALGITPASAPDEYEIEALNPLYEQIEQANAHERAVAVIKSEIPSGAAIEIKSVIVAVSPALFTALGAWVASRSGRKVRIKIGDIEAEAQTLEGVEKTSRTRPRNSAGNPATQPTPEVNPVAYLWLRVRGSMTSEMATTLASLVSVTL